MAAPSKPSSFVDTRVVYCGDNLEQLQKLPAARVDLIYIDPPFNSNRNYEVFWGETKEKCAFEDRHESTRAYIDYMRPRCVELARVLKKTGSFNCDWHAAHYLKVVTAMFVMVQFLFLAPLLKASDHDDAVSLDSKSKFTLAALVKMRTALAPLHPDKKQTPMSLENADGIYILYGNLFNIGHNYAVLALSGGDKEWVEHPAENDDPAGEIGLGFAEWKDGSWEPRGLWRIDPMWQKPEGPWLHQPRAKMPFWMKEFGGDGIPKVVVAGEVGKYHQDHYLLHFDPKKHRLLKVAAAMVEPEYVEGWVRLYDKSSNKATWEEWTYLQWENNKFVTKASWYEEVPYNEGEEEFLLVTHHDNQGKTTTYKVAYDVEASSVKQRIFAITRDKKPFAHISIKWGEKLIQPMLSYFPEYTYLFERLTGLPRKLFPERLNNQPSTNPEPIDDVIVSGDSEAVRLLSLKR